VKALSSNPSTEKKKKNWLIFDHLLEQYCDIQIPLNNLNFCCQNIKMSKASLFFLYTKSNLHLNERLFSKIKTPYPLDE
jgi:hypothetical protein